MKNKDRNTGYQKIVRVGDQKLEIVESTIGIIFFVWNSNSLFLYWEFSSPTCKKSPLPKVATLTQNCNLIYVPPI